MNAQDFENLPERTTKDGPFSWQSKAALQLIRERFDCNSAKPYAIAVYAALCELASNEGRETFAATRAKLAEMSGCGERQVFNVLGELREAGLVATFSPALKMPYRFRLLPVPIQPEQSGTGCRTTGTTCRTIGTEAGAFVPTSEERKERKEPTPQPPKGGGTSAASKSDRIRKTDSPVEPEALPHGQAFAEAWGRWRTFRAELRKPLKPSTVKLQLADLAAMPEPEAVAAIDQSIRHGWTGLFPLKPGNNGARPPRPRAIQENLKPKRVSTYE